MRLKYNISKKAIAGMQHVVLAMMALVGLSTMVASCDKDVFDINTDPFNDSKYLSDLDAPISEYLSTQSDYTEFVKALEYTDLYNALNQSTDGTSFTVFAPTNEAMQEFYKRRGVDSLKQLSQDYVKAFVLYHTIKDSVAVDALITKTSLTNLQGDGVKLAMDTINAGKMILNDEGSVTATGSSAYNGTIFQLSKAMTPLVETVYDRVSQLGTSSIMCEALQETGWDAQLNTIADTTVVNGSKIVTKRYYTLLNVTDDIFQKAGINSLADLKQKLQSEDQRGVSADSLLREYVAYHILGSSYKTSAIGALSGTNLTRIWGTSAKNQVFTVTTDTTSTVTEQERYTLNASSESAQFIPLTSNVQARNGYMHQLTAWLPVWEPQQETVIWDLGDYSEVKALVSSDQYQPAEAVSKENKFDISKAACYNYELSEESPKNNYYSAVTYLSCTKTIKAHNWDRVAFNVGYMGSVEMNTPTLVRGKYKVELSIYFAASNNFMRLQSDGNGGRLRMTIDDDNTIYTAPYTKVPSLMPGIYTSTLYDEIEFTETASHKLKFVVLDPAATSNSNFLLQFDVITFTPIK